jgi:protein kinase A
MRLYEKIIAGKIRYPSYFTEEAKDLLRNLLTADLTKRFGNLANGSRDIFGHAYFSEVDWSRLYRKEIPAPYVPRIEGDGDSSNFDSYAEIDISEYGVIGPDPHGHLFTVSTVVMRVHCVFRSNVAPLSICSASEPPASLRCRFHASLSS